MQSISELLGDDLFEGRAPGTRGGDLAEIYLKSLFKFMDLKPGVNGSYFQPFVMKGFSNSGVTVTANGTQLNYIDDVVGTFTVEEESINLDGEAVFVGFGITTSIWEWDDYKDVDVKDKIVITRINDPGMYNANIFEGGTLTYFGRWTYHIEEAARRGAAGILLIHTDQTAGYDWNVVKNSWTGEELYINSDLQNNLKFRGWIKESSLRKILDAKSISLDDLYEGTHSKDFQPIDLGFNIHIAGKNNFRDVTVRNVVAEIPGQTKERIVLSAHIDHLGMDPFKEGDNIYNGAIDNGTAVGAMMVVAKVLKEFQDDLHYSVTILGCNAEESGLLGSKYYVQNTGRDNIIANINFESTPVWDKSKSIMGIGARFSDFEEMIKDLAQKNNLEYSTFSLSNQGLFYRSDQFSFARYGIPSVWISAGEDEISGDKNYTEFWGKDYHTVKDEFDPEWELGGMKQTIQYALLLIDQINKSRSPPEWKSDLPFPMEE
ncbi:MAG: M28 family peptidase [Bacteroidales bacterium]|nr:M28 family peptidase [Bacteroidales bacterium]